MGSVRARPGAPPMGWRCHCRRGGGRRGPAISPVSCAVPRGPVRGARARGPHGTGSGRAPRRDDPSGAERPETGGRWLPGAVPGRRPLGRSRNRRAPGQDRGSGDGRASVRKAVVSRGRGGDLGPGMSGRGRRSGRPTGRPSPRAGRKRGWANGHGARRSRRRWGPRRAEAQVPFSGTRHARAASQPPEPPEYVPAVPVAPAIPAERVRPVTPRRGRGPGHRSASPGPDRPAALPPPAVPPVAGTPPRPGRSPRGRRSRRARSHTARPTRAAGVRRSAPSSPFRHPAGRADTHPGPAHHPSGRPGEPSRPAPCSYGSGLHAYPEGAGNARDVVRCRHFGGAGVACPHP